MIYSLILAVFDYLVVPSEVFNTIDVLAIPLYFMKAFDTSSAKLRQGCFLLALLCSVS